MALQEKIKITKIKELDSIEDEESQKLVDYVANNLKAYVGKEIDKTCINRLLDQVGQRLPEGGWKTLNIFIPIKASENPIYKKYNKSLIYCVILPLAYETQGSI